MGYELPGDLEKTIRGADTLIIAGADPLGDFPDLMEAFQSVKFLVVLELAMTPTAELADVVIPVAAFTEREGTFTSAERRVQIFHAASRSPTGRPSGSYPGCDAGRAPGYPIIGKRTGDLCQYW